MFLLIFSNTLFGQDFICGMPEGAGDESFQNCVVPIEVYDMIGRRVAVLANGSFTPGVHTFRLDGRTFASGIYIIRTDAGNKISTHRVTLLK